MNFFIFVFPMYEAYNKLVDDDFQIYSIKNDAFIIHKDDLTRVMGKSNRFKKN